MKEIPLTLGFADILLKPQFSDIRSRYSDEISLDTHFARGMPELRLPIVSANMDTVTEGSMAEAMALSGGLGIIHRNFSIQQQTHEVRIVKERTRIIEEHPPTLNELATIQDALGLLQSSNRGYVIVHTGESFNGSFSGIATTRDFLAKPVDMPISAVMTPNQQERLITVPQGTTLEQAALLMRQMRVEKVPVINEAGLLIGVYSLKDYDLQQLLPSAAIDNQGRLMVGAAIGVSNQEMEVERAHALIDAGVDALVLDIAHGHHQYIREMLYRLKVIEKISTPIIAGNVATAEGTEFLVDEGADGVKIGIGPGLTCETRDIAGTGVGQVSAILDAVEAMQKKQEQVPIIADGGIRKPHDIDVALGAGADTVMIGSLFAGTEESPGETVVIDGHRFKEVRGMASKRAQQTRSELGATTTDSKRYVPEGRVTRVPHRGDVTEILEEYAGGLRSAMSYSGSHTIREFHQKAELRRVTPAAANEQKRPLG